MIDQIQWLGHGSFLIQGPPFIYIDPWRVTRNAFHADLILVSHDHYDHCSVADINKLRGPHTTIIGNNKVKAQINGATVLLPWHSFSLDRTSIKAVPAYSPDAPQHPTSDGGLGFVISMRYFDIYYMGDTGLIDERFRIHPDILILPIDGNGTLTVEEAAQVVDELRPSWVIPCNWGSAGGSATLQDALDFKALVGGRSTVVLPSNDKVNQE